MRQWKKLLRPRALSHPKVRQRSFSTQSTHCGRRRTVFQCGVVIRRTWVRRGIGWCLAYLWTAAAAVAISQALDWQYDGGLAWWLVAAYSFPALILASPLLWLTRDPDLAAIYCLGALAATTVVGILICRPRAELPNGS